VFCKYLRDLHPYTFVKEREEFDRLHSKEQVAMDYIRFKKFYCTAEISTNSCHHISKSNHYLSHA
jgi:hypothetical protein